MTRSQQNAPSVTHESGYSIRVVSRLTGVNPDTLRMWERRYGFPRPQRSNTGVRTYSKADVERLTLVVRALKLGYRVGETIQLDDAILRDRLANSSPSRLGQGHVQTVQDLLDCIIADEPDSLRDKLRQAAANLGTRRFVVEVAAPLLHDMGQAWFEGVLDVQQEHVASEVILALVHMMRAAYEGSLGPTVLLATLPREPHGLGMHLVGLYLAAAGANVRIIGTDTPPVQIATAARSFNADAVAISISAAASTSATREHLNVLDENLDKSKALWLGGKGALRLDAPPARALCLNHWDEIDYALAALAARCVTR